MWIIIDVLCQFFSGNQGYLHSFPTGWEFLKNHELHSWQYFSTRGMYPNLHYVCSCDGGNMGHQFVIYVQSTEVVQPYDCCAACLSGCPDIWTRAFQRENANPQKEWRLREGVAYVHPQKHQHLSNRASLQINTLDFCGNECNRNDTQIILVPFFCLLRHHMSSELNV